MEERLDKILVQMNVAESRAIAEKMIRKTGVKVDGKLINKPGKKCDPNSDIQIVKTTEDPLLTRGLKLKEAIQKWKLEIKNKTILDLGSAKGSFANVLVENHAKQVYCVDFNGVELDPALNENSKIIELKNTGVRDLPTAKFDSPIDGITIDITSFSINSILPFIHSLLKANKFVIAIYRPYLDTDKVHLSKEGVLKNKKIINQKIIEVKETVSNNNFDCKGQIDSPMLGLDGNQEYILYLIKQ